MNTILTSLIKSHGMKIAFNEILFVLSVTMISIDILFFCDGLLTGMAGGIYFFSHINIKNWGRVLATSSILILIAFIPWGALLGASFLLSIWVAECYFAHHIILRISRLLSFALCGKSLLFCITPGLATYLHKIPSSPEITFVFYGLIIVFTMLGLRYWKKTQIDPFLTLLITIFLIIYNLTVALLAASISYTSALFLAATGFTSLLAAAIFIMAPFREGRAFESMQHAFSLQISVESWVQEISHLAASENNVKQFTAAVMHKFLDLSGVRGVSWKIDNEDWQHLEKQDKKSTTLHCPPLTIQLHTFRWLSPWLWFNYYLLARIAAEYCLGKQREEKERTDNLYRAVHETGARLTHDIKNIIHTITALTEKPERIEKHLPTLKKRLQSTLLKLQISSDENQLLFTSAKNWWEEKKKMHEHLIFQGSASASISNPLFDLAFDNFVSNAMQKRNRDPLINITVHLQQTKQGVELRVIDTGEVVATTTATMIFQQPVASKMGFGVGLYQVSIEAKKQHYLAQLEKNETGNVVFVLRPNPLSQGNNSNL